MCFSFLELQKVSGSSVWLLYLIVLHCKQNKTKQKNYQADLGTLVFPQACRAKVARRSGPHTVLNYVSVPFTSQNCSVFMANIAVSELISTELLES